MCGQQLIWMPSKWGQRAVFLARPQTCLQSLPPPLLAPTSSGLEMWKMRLRVHVTCQGHPVCKGQSRGWLLSWVYLTPRPKASHGGSCATWKDRKGPDVALCLEQGPWHPGRLTAGKSSSRVFGKRTRGHSRATTASFLEGGGLPASGVCAMGASIDEGGGGPHHGSPETVPQAWGGEHSCRKSRVQTCGQCLSRSVL